MAGGSGDDHNLLSCVILKTIETIETIFLLLKSLFLLLKSSNFVVPSPQFYLKSRLSFCQF